MNPQNLLFSLVDDFGEADVTAIRDLVKWLSREGCPLDAPEFVDETDDESCTSPDDVPVRTVGGVLRLAAQYPNREAEAAQYQQVELLIQSLAELSRSRNLDIELELNGDCVGDIRSGQISRSITDGLLAPWRTTLGSNP